MPLLPKTSLGSWRYDTLLIMDKAFTSYNFTPEHPTISFNTRGMKLTIEKFVMLSEGKDFLSNHLLGFQVKVGDVTHPVKSFVGCISPSQKDPTVAEVNMIFQSEEKSNTEIYIVNQGEPQDYSITMVYDLQPS